MFSNKKKIKMDIDDGHDIEKGTKHIIDPIHSVPINVPLMVLCLSPNS